MDDKCVMCGAYVPEGRMVCYNCEKVSRETSQESAANIAIRYARDVERMCSSFLFHDMCSTECPFWKAREYGQGCRQWIVKNPEKAVKIVLEWGEKNKDE